MKVGDRHPNLNLLRVRSVDKDGNPTSWESISPAITPNHPQYARLASRFRIRHLTRIDDDCRIPGSG